MYNMHLNSNLQFKWFIQTILVIVIFSGCKQVKNDKVSDSRTPLHALQPAYDIPYSIPRRNDIEQTLTRVYEYLNANTPMKLVEKSTEQEIVDYTKIDTNTILAPGDFRLISYEWGVTYAGMMLAGKVTGDNKYTNYTFKRFTYISDVLPYFKKLKSKSSDEWNALTSVTNPSALDHAGSMCAAMIKATQNGIDVDLRPTIDNYIDYISNKEFRLTDGTLARNRPMSNTIWLDDLFMSVPALARMGKLTGEQKYYDDAVRQVMQFSSRMFNSEKGLFMHGWVENMEPHPEFYWARANGWALMAIVELLDVLPNNHPGYEPIMKIMQAHIKGLAAKQSEQGFWHQLLDRNDSYLETSATAIYTYSIAKAINNGWIDSKAYGPMVILAWNAVSTKVNSQGQVEGTCVGTGMAFDPAFYFYRPTNVHAAHGYGPVLLAGAEMITLIESHKIDINDSAIVVDKK